MADSKAKLYWPPTELFPVKAVGARYYRAGISQVAQNSSGNSALVFCVATLVPERDNAHDQNAVLVQIGTVSVGHLSRDFAQEFRARLDAIDEIGRASCRERVCRYV